MSRATISYHEVVRPVLLRLPSSSLVARRLDPPYLMAITTTTAAVLSDVTESTFGRSWDSRRGVLCKCWNAGRLAPHGGLQHGAS